MKRVTNLRVLIAVALLTILIGCGGGGGGGTGLNLSRVKVDEDRAGKATIGPAGGTITATGADGAVYTLTVPADALTDPTEIALYPVIDIQGQPFPGGMTAGFHLTPEGLQFDRAATLTVQLPAGTDTTNLTGFGYAGDGEELHLYPMLVEGSTLTFQISHFSGGAGGRGPGGPGRPTNTVSAVEHDIALAVQKSTSEADLVVDLFNILKQWYEASVRPGLVAAAGADPVGPAIDRYAVWRQWVMTGRGFSTNVQAQLRANLGSELVEAAILAAEAIRAGINRANQRCVANTDLRQAVTVLRLQRRASNLDLDDEHPDLRLQPVKDGLCVKVKIETEFPSTLQIGQTGTLRVRAGYTLGGGSVKFLEEMAITQIPNFATDNTPYGGPSQGGLWLERSYTRAGDQPLQLHIIARFQRADLRDLMAEVYLSAGGTPGIKRCTDLAGTYRGMVTLKDLGTGHEEYVVDRTLDVTDTTVGNAGYFADYSVSWVPSPEDPLQWTTSGQVSFPDGSVSMTATITTRPDGKCDSLHLVQISRYPNGLAFSEHTFDGRK
jgi:hypothetical protein